MLQSKLGLQETAECVRTKASLYYTSDWIKIPVLRILCKVACILIPCFLANFIIKENLI